MKPPIKKSRLAPAAETCELSTAFSRAGTRWFFGYIADPNNLGRKFSVEILVDGVLVRVVRADAYVHELARKRFGDGYYGFSCTLQENVVGDSAIVEARLANVGTLIGEPIILARPSGSTLQPSGPGEVRWLGGLRFSGWLADREEEVVGNVHVDGAFITRIRASTWRHLGTSDDNARAVRGFDLYLPERFADGRAHYLVVTNDAGETIGAKSLAFVAYPDGLRDLVIGRNISEQDQLRAQLFDRQVPMSLPLSEYQGWREKLITVVEQSTSVQCAVILVGPGALEDSLNSLNEQDHVEWLAASVPQAPEPTGLSAELVSDFLETDGADCGFVVFALAGTLFSSSALERLAHAFASFPNAKAVYTDLDIKNDGRTWPIALSAFDYERMLEQGYCAHIFALRRAAAVQSLERGASNLYRLFNSIFDEGMSAAVDIVHLPNPIGTLPRFDKDSAAEALANASIAHLQHLQTAAAATAKPGGIFPAVQITRTIDPPPTTIIIPTRNRHDLLQRCIKSIRPAVERTRAKILIVDNDSSNRDTLDYLVELEKTGATILHVAGEFNFPHLNNLAAEVATGDVLCLLNNDIKALDDFWLDEMLSRVGQRDVGAVGALLVWPSGIIQHGGVVLGPNFSVAHAFNDRIDGDAGYGEILYVAHECSAVTAACMVTRRSDYLEVGGMDELCFPVNFNDVDYCLKLRALGKRIVFTPHAKLVHLESASRRQERDGDSKGRFERELQNLRAKWGKVLTADPYYSPMLSLDPIPYSALAWPVRGMDPRVNDRPEATSVPSGF